MNINDNEFVNSLVYQKFIENNPGKGYLKIRAYAASEALPVVGLRIIVSSLIENEKVIFFDGITDDSGMIDTLTLPTPKLDNSNLEIPLTINYSVEAIKDTINKKFSVDMYDGVCVVQNINFVPGGNNVS